MTSEQTKVCLHRTIQASPGHVYRAWLDPELLARWMAPGDMKVTRVEVDERVGGRYRIWHRSGADEVGGFECELLQLVPDERIVFRWGFAGPERTSGPVFDSLLTITLSDAGDDATELTLIHERLDTLRASLPEVADNVESGWRSALDKLTPAVLELAHAQRPTLYVCDGDDRGPRIHPCRRVQDALRAHGIDHDKLIAGHGSPWRFLRKGSRDELRAATGDTKLPALKLADGTVITHSRAILSWIRDSGS